MQGGLHAYDASTYLLCKGYLFKLLLPVLLLRTCLPSFSPVLAPNRHSRERGTNERRVHCPYIIHHSLSNQQNPSPSSSSIHGLIDIFSQGRTETSTTINTVKYGYCTVAVINTRGWRGLLLITTAARSSKYEHADKQTYKTNKQKKTHK